MRDVPGALFLESRYLGGGAVGCWRGLESLKLKEGYGNCCRMVLAEGISKIVELILGPSRFPRCCFENKSRLGNKHSQQQQQQQ